MLSICFEGIAIPIMWKVLKKDGTTSGKEQIAFIERFIKQFGRGRIEGLLGDREFANKRFIGWLVKSKIPFYIRIKGNTMVSIEGRKFYQAKRLFPSMKAYESQVFGMKVELFGEQFFLSASRNEKKELMIIVSNGSYKTAIPTYLRRWEVECLFQALKSRGFRFEDTHVTAPERIEKMIALLAIGVAWAHKTGEWRVEKKAIPMKTINNQRRPQYSFFRYGLDLIRDAILTFKPKTRLFNQCLKLLDFTPKEAFT